MRKRENKQKRDLETKEKYIIENGGKEIEIGKDKREVRPREKEMERVKRLKDRVRFIE